MCLQVSKHCFSEGGRSLGLALLHRRQGQTVLHRCSCRHNQQGQRGRQQPPAQRGTDHK